MPLPILRAFSYGVHLHLSRIAFPHMYSRLGYALLQQSVEAVAEIDVVSGLMLSP